MMPNRHILYERSVQSPKAHVRLFSNIFDDLRRNRRKGVKTAQAATLREDFCGTFAFSCEWVKSDPTRRALGIDLDAEVLASGLNRHWKKLTPSQRRRVKVRCADVRSITRPQSDLIVAGNFSHYGLRSRRELLEYFRCCHASLKDKRGLLILEAAGGPGFIQPGMEKKTFRIGKHPFTYVWDQQEFDPITRNGKYAIHFRDQKTKEWMHHAFMYDWRVWGIPEVRDALADAGFSSSAVYWETTHRGLGTGEFVRAESAENSYQWLAYIVGIKG